MISIVVPTLNEAAGIAETLEVLQGLSGAKEILVADGGSEDGTVEIVRGMGVRVVMSLRGRGAQLRAGASEAVGEVIWMVHADTKPEPGALQAMERALENPQVAGGNFSLIFEGEHYSAKQMTKVYPYLRWLGLSYGDAGIFVRREVYEAFGGCRAYALFEDVDLVGRIKSRGRFAHLDARIVTSARRFAGPQYVRVWATWITLQVLFWGGVSPDRLARWYRQVR